MRSSKRPLTKHELNNVRLIGKRVGDYALLFVTGTGLRKSTFDATESIRALFKRSGFHDYDLQGRGRKRNGIEANALFVTSTGVCERKVSLFKPSAKPTQGGDPRFWPSLAKSHLGPEDVAALFIHKGQLCFINVSRETVGNTTNDGHCPSALDDFLVTCEEANLELALELIGELRALAAAGPLRAKRTPEAVGFAIESALGLERNARGNPDYKNMIEIKSGRGTKNRLTLLTCAPDWELASRLNRTKKPADRLCTSPQALLHRYGYWRNDKWKIACDVKATNFNPQGLRLHFDEAKGLLLERYRGMPRNVAVWSINELHGRLAEKHPQTMFINAKSEAISGDEELLYLQKATYVRSPNLARFDELLQSGKIIMGHRKSNKDHGVAFRIDEKHAFELFTTEPRTFDLAFQRRSEL